VVTAAQREAGWSALAKPDIRFTGATRLRFDSGLDRRTPAYADISLGVSASRERLTLRSGVDNLANTRADTFAFGNPFSIRTTQQFTPLQPRTISIGAAVRW
jgi:iron complex outermembrane receptor protein